ATQDLYRMYLAAPATTADGQEVVLRVSESLDDIAALSAQTRRVGLLLLVVLLPISVAAAWWLSRYASQPVERLAESALEMADGNLSSPVPHEPGALRPLSGALNALREQLRKRLTDLEAEQDMLRVALNGLADGVLLLEGEDVTLTNEALCKMFRLVASKLGNIGNLGLPSPIEHAISSNRDASSPRIIDLGPDPFKRYHTVTVIPLASAKRRSLVVIQDVSNLRHLDAVRRDFVANAAHELKTPTASILLLSQSANQAANDGDTEQAVAFLAQVSPEAERLRRLVADLLDLSRLESTPSAGQVTDVRRAIELAIIGHTPSARAKALSLTSDLAKVAGQDVAALCDSTDLAVALDNLLANAVAYTKTGAVVVSVEADVDVVRILVTDTGIGIPESEVERVFERFYRVDRARSRKSGGTGLGLSLVRNIAERAGGSASITSGVGTGTTVTLLLRRAL
ncbi:MAG: ATP-binding protein, partial [Coriobacteriia bacterium]|nr:ATP-binding protein [Coriobacteriia bacterium]